MASQNQNESQSNIPHLRLRDFMRTVTPFDTLASQELEMLVSRMEMAFFPRGQHIVDKGDPPFRYLHVIQQGAAGIYLTDERGEKMLVDVRGEGDYFGGTSLLQEKPAMFDIIAQQDLITLMIPAVELQQLVAKYPVFQRYFGSSLARTIQAARDSAVNQRPRLIGDNAVNLDVFMTGKRVADLMSKNVLTCAPGVSVQTAAKLMAQRRVSSIVVSGNRLYPLGIVTDNDLRTKVLAAGLSPEVSVTEIMSRPVQTISADAYSFDALLAMSRHGVRLLVVMEADRMVGIISEHDLQMETGSSPVQVIGEIERAVSLKTILGLRPKIDSVLESLLRQGGPVKQLVSLVTELNDRLALRILRLVEHDVKHDRFFLQKARPAKVVALAADIHQHFFPAVVG